MFKYSKNHQGDMFKDISNQLSKRKRKLMDLPSSWHNVMWQQVVSQIDETPYCVLFDQYTGRPNASIRVLIGMMILKEGNGWSDEQLFDECRFNIKVMHSLGLHQIDDDVPVESTYYDFRRVLGNYLETTHRDLLKETFAQITSSQVSRHGLSGKKIRMDSKLINSNIAKSNRLTMIIEALRNYVKKLSLEKYRRDFSKEVYGFLKSLQEKSSSNISYPLNGKEKSKLLVELGPIIGALLDISTSASKSYKVLKRVYEEQYKQQSQDNDKGKTPQQSKIVPKSPKDIPSGSVQSVHDPEASYRSKGQGESKQIVSGYHANVTESCEKEDSLNLILDVEVVGANISEDSFLIATVENSKKILDQSKGENKEIEEVITDGGYDSVKNREDMLKENRPVWSIAKMKGGPHRYKMNYDEQNKLQVKESKSGKPCELSYSNRAQKYVIKTQDGAKRYMTQSEIDNYINHQQIIDQVKKESYNLRASAESTIHQVFHRLKKRNKIVYRGLIRCQWYVLSRAFWVNIVRIGEKEVENALNITFLILIHPWKHNIAKLKIKTILIDITKYYSLSA